MMLKRKINWPMNIINALITMFTGPGKVNKGLQN